MAAVGLSSQASADRLVSIDGSLTEIIYALGAEADLVGVDTTSIYPEAATNLPDVILVFHSQKRLDELATNPALSLTQAVQNGQLYSVDDLNLLSFGPRLGVALQGLLERMMARS